MGQRRRESHIRYHYGLRSAPYVAWGFAQPLRFAPGLQTGETLGKTVTLDWTILADAKRSKCKEIMQRGTRYQAVVLKDHLVLLLRIEEEDQAFWLIPGGGKEGSDIQPTHPWLDEAPLQSGSDSAASGSRLRGCAGR